MIWSGRMLSAAVCIWGLLVFNTPGQVNARCGMPDLPYKAQMLNINKNDEPLLDWEYFEDNQLMKVVCQDGLLGVSNQSLDQEINWQLPNKFLSIQMDAIIQCKDNRWNSSNLFCLQSINIDWNWLLDDQNHSNDEPRTTKHKTTNSFKVHSSVLMNKHHHQQEQHQQYSSNNISCIELNANNTSLKDNITFQVQLDTRPSAIPRLVLILQQQYQIPKNQTSQQQQQGKVDSLSQNEILQQSNYNLADNLNHTIDENAEVEENKHGFMDIVLWNELFANHSGNDNLGENHPQILSEQSIKSDQRPPPLTQIEYSIKTWFAKLSFSVQLDNSGNVQQGQQCYFNEDITIGHINQPTTSNHSSRTMTHFLIFDCPFMTSDQKDQLDSFRIKINVGPLEEAKPDHELADSINLCQIQMLEVANEFCDHPSIPINGIVNRITRGEQKIAQYSCTSNYRITDMKHELQTGLNQVEASQTQHTAIVERYCNNKTKRWLPDISDVLCVPKHWCRSPPPMPDATQFWFEYSKLDNMNRAVADMSLATLRCIMVTHNVVPFTIYRCGQNGQWIKLGVVKNRTEPEPTCILSKYRGGGYRAGYRRYRYYHYYPAQSSSNMNTLLWGHRLTDNKYLTYYGVAGIVILFLGSFIILIHVRRMAKKMSTQMREQAYMNMDKSGPDGPFMAMNSAGSCSSGFGGQLDMDNPPDYYNETNFFENSTMYSSDLPPPATPISMPSTLNHSVGSAGTNGKHSKNNLSANFDSIKF